MPSSESGAIARKTTMRDVAREADVSIMTVSNVINDRDGKVSSETRERVMSAIALLGYRVNTSARSLRKGRTGVVCLAVPAVASLYYGELAERLFSAFRARGIHLVVERTVEAVEAELASLNDAHLEGYDGLILTVAKGEAEDLDRVSPSKPVVLIGERAFSRQYDHVLMDNIAGSRLATSHLLATGARRIALIGGRIADHDGMPELRTRGYMAALEEAGVPIDPALVVESGWTHRDGYQATTGLLNTDAAPDAIFALTDAAALGAIRALRDQSVRIPDEVQVIGWDATEIGEYSVPRLTTIDPSNDAMAESIASLLIARMEDPEPDSERRIVMTPSSVLVRESTREIRGDGVV
ncbi:LacI family DNA-binding transcriptional regulator [Microbacterium sp. I2]|uniref:LacI family DNA-binding transcriptional regulator n=1 Tax=Microbacterium sp. I2 TaxID=3391826 RepID=UPI003EDB67B5